MKRNGWIALLLALAATAPSVAAADTSLSMTSDPGDYIGQGRTYFFDQNSAVFTPSLLGGGNGIQMFVNVGNYQQWWYLNFGAADGAPLTVGTYVDATRYGVPSPGHPGIDVYGNGNGCNQQSGAFQVKQLTISNGSVTRLWIRFVQHCENATTALTGDLRLNADVSVLVDAPFEQRTVVGQPVTVQFTGRATSGETVTLAANSLPPGASFVDHGDGTGTVSWTPTQVGSYPVTVLGTASTGQDQSTTIVKVDEVPLTGDTSLRMTSDVGDFIGQGLSYSFTPADGSFITYVGYPGATNAAHVEFYTPTFGETWDLVFSAQNGASPTPGLYVGARRVGSDVSLPGLDINGDGRGCNMLNGAFEVKQLVISGGTLKRIWARFEQHCEGFVPALTGEIRYVADVTVAVTAPFHRTVPRGQPVTIDVSATSTSGPVALSATGLPDGAHFEDFGNNTGRLTWTPSVGQLGVYPVAFIGDDGQGHTDRSTTIVEVTGVTSLLIDSEADEPIAHGVDAYYTPDQGNFSVSQRFYDKAADFRFTTPSYSANWGITLTAPNNQVLTPGTYEDAVGSNGSIAQPRMTVAGNGSACFDLTGRFVVRQADYNPDNTIRAFWATFEETCMSFTTPLFGELRFNANVITDVTAPSADTLVVGHQEELQVTATNAAGRHVVLTASGLPDGATFVDHGDDTGTFTWTPAFHQIGRYRVSFTGDDGAGGVDSAATRLFVPGETSLIFTEGPSGARVLTPTDGTFSGFKTSEGRINIDFTERGGSYAGWHLSFGAPLNAVLQPGFYPGASIVQVFGGSAPAPTYPVLEVMQRAFVTYCTPFRGLFQIKQARYGDNGALEEFWATFEEHCDPGQRDVGEIRFNAAVDVAVQAPLSAEVLPGQSLEIPVRATDRLGRHVTVTASGVPNGAMFIDHGDNSGVLTWRPGRSAIGLHDVSFAADNGDGGIDQASTHIRVDGKVRLVIDGDPSDPVGGGRSGSFGPSDGPFDVWKNYKEGASLHFSQGAQSYLGDWYLNLAAPHSMPLAPGVYEPVSYYPYESAEDAGLSLDHGYDPCTAIDGRFEIQEITYGPGVEIASMRATFEQHCASSTAGVRGELRWNEPTGCGVVMGVDIDPNALNLRSRGKWVSVYLEPPEGHAASDIDVASVLLDNSVPVAAGVPVTIGDHDGDGIPDLELKFSRSALQALVSPGDDSVAVSVGGQIGGDCFEGADTIRIVRPIMPAPPAGSVLTPRATVNVIWTPDADLSVDLLSSFDGATWNVEARGLDDTGHYTWRVPARAAERARLRVVTSVAVVRPSGSLTGVGTNGITVPVILGESGTFSIAPVTAVNDIVTFAMSGIAPNPTRREFTVSFSLPTASPATLALYDITGRQVVRREIGSMGPGRHAVALGSHEALRPGIYEVRLTQSGASLKSRVVVIE